MKTADYLIRMKNLNHVLNMVRKQRRDLMTSFMTHMDLIPGETVLIVTTHKDKMPSGKYILHEVEMTFDGEHLRLDVESVDGTYYTYQVPIDKLDERVKPLRGKGQLIID